MYLVITCEDLCEGEIGLVVGHMTKLYAYGHDIYCGGITPKNQRSITDTNKEKLKEPIPNDDQGTIATGTKGKKTTA